MLIPEAGASSGSGTGRGAAGAAPPSRENTIATPSSSMRSRPSSVRVSWVPSIWATPSETVHTPVSVLSPSNMATVPSAFRVTVMVMSRSARLKASPAISMETPCHSPRKGSPASPTGWAGWGVAVGSGVGMGSLFTAESSASTSGSCAGSVRHFSAGKATD